MDIKKQKTKYNVNYILASIKKLHIFLHNNTTFQQFQVKRINVKWILKTQSPHTADLGITIFSG